MQRVVPYLPTQGTIGGWQSGALSYFAPAQIHVVNLDGVTNPDAAAAQHRGRLADYMKRRHIVLIADFPQAALFLSMHLGVPGQPQPTQKIIATIDGDQNSPPYELISVDWRN
jgi:hypothetical protein